MGGPAAAEEEERRAIWSAAAAHAASCAGVRKAPLCLNAPACAVAHRSAVRTGVGGTGEARQTRADSNERRLQSTHKGVIGHAGRTPRVSLREWGGTAPKAEGGQNREH